MTDLKKLFVMIFIPVFFFNAANPVYAFKSTLYDEFADQKEVLTYIHPVISASEDDAVCTEVLYERLVSAFEARISNNFELQDSESDAEIEVRCEILDYSRPEIASIENISDIFSRIWCFFSQSDRGRLSALFTVKATDEGEILFRRELTSTVSSSSIDKEDSFDELSKRLVKAFFRAAFSKRDDIGRIST